jgi:hypothetical protein
LDTRKEISTKTIRRMLKEVNLIARKPATGPILTALQKKSFDFLFKPPVME